MEIDKPKVKTRQENEVKKIVEKVEQKDLKIKVTLMIK